MKYKRKDDEIITIKLKKKGKEEGNTSAKGIYIQARKAHLQTLIDPNEI